MSRLVEIMENAIDITNVATLEKLTRDVEDRKAGDLMVRPTEGKPSFLEMRHLGYGIEDVARQLRAQGVYVFSNENPVRGFPLIATAQSVSYVSYDRGALNLGIEGRGAMPWNAENMMDVFDTHLETAAFAARSPPARLKDRDFRFGVVAGAVTHIEETPGPGGSSALIHFRGHDDPFALNERRSTAYLIGQLNDEETMQGKQMIALQGAEGDTRVYVRPEAVTGITSPPREPGVLTLAFGGRGKFAVKKLSFGDEKLAKEAREAVLDASAGRRGFRTPRFE